MNQMKFNLLKSTATVIFCASLTACFEKTDGEPIQTVEWYKTHDNEREEKIAECSNDPGTLKETPNCVNAIQAANQLSSGSLRSVDW